MKRHRLSLFVLLLLGGILAGSGIAAAQQNRGMGIPAADLPEDLRKLDVKDHFIPSDFREVGVLHAMNGHVVVVHRAKGEAFFGKPGDKIYENDEMNTLDDSRCRIRFYSDDVVNMAPDTQFAVEAFEDQRTEGKKRSLFSMVKGKAMFYALRLFRYKDTRFKVKTPTAVVGVRGTKFGLDVFWLNEGTTAGSNGIQVADSGRGFDVLLAQNQGQGMRSGTRAACGDGTLDITDPVTGGLLVQLNANGEYNSYTGEETYDPRNPTLNGIQRASQVRQPGETGEDEGPPPPQPPAGGGDQPLGDTGMPDTTLMGEDQINVVQQQTGDETLTGSETFQPFQGTECCPLKGYFSALLLYHSSGSIREAFGSTHLQVLDPLSDAYAYGACSSSSHLYADENESGNDEGKLYLDPEGASDKYSWQGTSVYKGQYSYLQWGYHMASTTIMPVVGGTVYELINKIWFVEGYPTAAADLAALSGDYTYTGGVQGTYYSKTEQVDMTGTYSSQVHFGSSYIHDFVLNASGGGHTVDFTQTGSASINSDGEFQISSGTFNIDGSSVGCWSVDGAHFGPGAAEQGGSYDGWCSTSNCGAYGVYYGRQQP